MVRQIRPNKLPHCRPGGNGHLSCTVVSDHLVELSTKAVTLVRDSDKSELSDLWLDSGGSYREWHAGVTELIGRLS